MTILARRAPPPAERIADLSRRLEHLSLHAGEPRSIAASALMVAAVRILCEDFEPGRAAQMLKSGIDNGIAANRRRLN
jgi:hypothetical protein